MDLTSKYIALKEYIPLGKPSLSHFELKEIPLSLEKNDDVLVKNKWISVDPYMRARMTERKNYKPPFEIGKPMEGAAIGEVINSKSPDINIGDIVLSEFGWRDQFVSNYKNLKKIYPIDVPLQTYLGPLGMTGHTAYIGLFKIANIQNNQTVLVSSAGGSVGSTVCQIAKILGCKVIASTGSDKKVEWLKRELGVDHAFNYKKVDNLVLHLKSLAPEGYDLYKSPNLMNGWKLNFLHPEHASVEGKGNQLTIRYTGEDNSFYGGLTDGFIVSMTMSTDEALKQRIENNTPEKMGDYEVYSYRALNSIGSAQVEHYLIQLTEAGDSQPVYAVFSMAVKGDSEKEYKALIKEIFESMSWTKTKI